MKKIMRVLLAALCIASIFALGSCRREQARYIVAFAVQDLTNPTWGGTAEELDRLIRADGGEFIFMDTRIPSVQIEQVENFITRGVDAIIIHVADPFALEEVLGRARAAGIRVFSWDTDIANSDINWLISNYELGSVIGYHAAQWINERHGGVADYAILNFDAEAILLERGNGIRNTMARLAPNARLVADQPAINALEGQSAVETILLANPDLQVIASIGGGGAVGANNAVLAAGRLTDDFGIFAADATDLEILAMEQGEAVRMSVMISGSPRANAGILFNLVTDLIDGQVAERNIMRELIPITIENTHLTR